MNFKILVALISVYSIPVKAIDENGASLEDVVKRQLQSYPLPTSEKILSSGLSIQSAAQELMEQKNEEDCPEKIGPPPEALPTELNITKNDCLVCAVMNPENEKEYQLLVGNISIEDNAEKGIFFRSPNEISLSYSGANDQILNGLTSKYLKLGDDLNGHTYGSNLNATAKYNWGELTLDMGSNLYVQTYDYLKNGEIRPLRAKGLPKRYLQEADENTYLRLGAKLYLDESQSRSKDVGHTSPYVKFGLGIEHDSDQGTGWYGAIYQREVWHELGGISGNEYVNHFRDETRARVSAKAGLEKFEPMGKLGFCSIIEGGFNTATNGNITAEGSIKLSADSGTLGGASRNAPIVVINLEAGYSVPIQNGEGPKLESDANHGNTLTNKNYPLIGDTKNAFTSIGVEVGTRRMRFSVDAIYQKNQWNDGDIIYMTTIKGKF